jgi:hypothetical protein
MVADKVVVDPMVYLEVKAVTSDHLAVFLVEASSGLKVDTASLPLITNFLC